MDGRTDGRAGGAEGSSARLIDLATVFFFFFFFFFFFSSSSGCPSGGERRRATDRDRIRSLPLPSPPTTSVKAATSAATVGV